MSIGEVASAQGGPALGGERKIIMYYVYILYSKSIKKLYKGSTNDLRRRIKEHNSGHVKFTSSGKPWVLIHYQGFLNKKDTVREELFLKTGKGRERIKFLLKETLEKIN